MTVRKHAIATTSLALLCLAANVAGQTDAPPSNNYADAKTWLCRPDLPREQNACAIDNTTTVVATSGTFTREAWQADPKASVDCFYVYPTVSTDPTPTSDMIADPAERNVIRQQFARFGSVCRQFAPLYRQVTLVGLRRALGSGGRASFEQGVQYDDVRDAWNYYLEHENRGRGVVLVAHSQGSFILTELIRREIDGKPVQSRLVSAILLGTTLAVPKGKDVGGAFQHVPLCHSASQTGCVITYASFRSTIPPPANTLFGKVAGPDMVAACTNPAALSGGSGTLHAYLSKDGTSIVGNTPPKPWVTPEKPVETPFVSLPGLLTAQCATNENATYLEVTVHGDPAGPRTSDIVGDLNGANGPQPNWGLHLIDVNLGMGNLIDIVRAQAKAYGSLQTRH
jgi:Protein of unknown function (DUF3089)